MHTLPTWYVKGRKSLEQYFKPEFYQGTTIQKHDSYTLKLDKYIFPIKKYNLILNFHHGIIYKDEKVISEFKSNSQEFWHYWSLPYFLCNESDQGYTIIDLNKKEKHTYARRGWGWFWKEIKISDDQKLLAVKEEGFDGWLGRISIYDFSKPHQIPLPLIKTLPNQKLIGWNGNNLVVDDGFQKTEVTC